MNVSITCDGLGIDNYVFNKDGSILIMDSEQYREATEEEKSIIAMGYSKYFDEFDKNPISYMKE